MSMVVRVRSQTQQLPTCLRYNLIIPIQDVMMNASTSLGRRLLTCVHSMTRCFSCRNCWDGLAQCSCYKEPRVDSDEYESRDEDVFSPKPRSVSPDSTKP